ncbi:MAG TPA: beta-ketoacyl-[acyl-carrier-protein] synthase II, partial [Armatimonadetes bacterium]|nr:beta-ketoacyl-[acyl-carrier-protein] synthase II [Armatimonadota bacterium]
MKQRVVVTGMGVITPLGNDCRTLWEALLRGKSGAGPITYFDSTGYETRIAAQVKDFRPEEHVERKHLRRMDRVTQYAVVAALQAVADAGLEITDQNRDRIGVLIGSGIGGVETWDREHRALLEKGPKWVSPLFVPMLIANMGAGYVSILTGARGPNKSVVTACATGAHAIGDAFRWIQYGEAEAVIAGGAEAAIRPLPIAGFAAMKAMTTRNEEPQRASRPFDRDRDGFLMGEGAGVVILESLAHAQRRGARIYAEVIGYGLSGDAYHVAAPLPCGTGAAYCMHSALQDASLNPADIDYLNAHAPSTPAGDASETVSIKKVFGSYAYHLPVSSTKSMTGHLLGAAGSVEFVISVLALIHNLIPPTINYETPDPECDLDCVPNEPREARLEAVMTNA